MSFFPAVPGLGGTFGARPASGQNWQRYEVDNGGPAYVWDPSVPGPSGGPQWRPQLAGVLGWQPPAAAVWTAVNAPTSIADASGTLTVVGGSDIPGGTNLRGYSLNAGRTFTSRLEALFAMHGQWQYGTNPAMNIGLALRNSGTGALFTLAIATTGAQEAITIETALWTDVNTKTGTSFDYNSPALDGAGPLWLSFETNPGFTIVTPSYSRNRIVRQPVTLLNGGPFNLAALLGGIPDQVLVTSVSSSAGQPVFDVFSFKQDPPS
jgi:hypothetical protein